MKRILCTLAAAVMVLGTAAGCGETRVYNLSDVLPPLMDLETQYPYVERITVTDLATGETVRYTEPAEHNLIRMQFEQKECVREKGTPTVTEGYSVTFITTDGKMEVIVPAAADAYQAPSVYINGYEYEFLLYGVDLPFFAGLFDD